MTNAGRMNNNFYASPPTPEEVRRRLAMQQGEQGQQGMQNHGMGMVNPTGIGGPSTGSPLSAMASGGGDSLDDIVSHNTRELQRRRSVPYASFADPLSPQTDDRCLSMMDYTTSGDAFQAFPYGNMGAPQDAMAGLDSFSSGADLPGSSALYSPQGLMAISNQQIYGTLAPKTLGIAASMSSMDMGSMATNPASMSIFSPPDLSAQYPPAALDASHIDYAMDMGIGHAPLNAFNVDGIASFAVGGGNNNLLGADQAFDSTTPVPGEEPAASLIPDVAGLSPFPAQANVPTPEAREASVPASFRSPAGSTPSRTMSHSSAGQSRAGGGTPVTSGPVVPRDPKKDVYSKSGFDMLRALFYVATRKNPTVEIGAVDMSCAFVVCDLTLNDCPIVYVSDNFQNLTGYNRHEIVGQNCRFLQSPDGKVEAGTKREFVANDAVYKLKTAVAEGREIQQSLINYRKGGKPFLNLLTMIPIPWDTDEMRYCIGFQIDLVECPQAISGQDPGGGMHVNYRHNDIGQYIFSPPSSTHWEPAESCQTLSVDEVSTLVEQFKPSAPPTEWHKQSWDKMLLENADDVIHVLSLKGLFLYLSPACKKILEYDAADLVGTSLSSICHPSDIVPVTRELKDAQPGGGTVDIAFRIRRKHSGYTWFESHGTLLCEQSKGRKYIVLVGRKRPVLTLRRRDVDAAAPAPGLGDSSEMWSKMSCAGMLLFVSSAARSLLDVPPAELEGTSMQELMRKESRVEFGRTIEKARKGAVAGFRHEVLHKRGQLLPAYTVFYPGDVSGPGQKASFLIAQTKVAKGAARVIAGGSKVGGGATTTIAAAMGAVVPFPDAMSGVVMGAQSQLVLTSAEDDGSSEEDDDVFAELKTTRCTSWQYELRQMEKMNRLLADELTQLMANKKKRKRRKGGGTGAGGSGSGGGNGAGAVRDCANCHRKDTPEWRRGPSGNRDLCNSCGLRWAKQTGKVTPRNSRAGSGAESVTGGGGGGGGGKRGSASTASSNSPAESSPLRREVSTDAVSAASSGGQERGSSFGEPVAGGWDAMGSIREE